ncbi:hypothetical protein AB3X21_22450, partial [Roseomonas mucosa]
SERVGGWGGVRIASPIEGKDDIGNISLRQDVSLLFARFPLNPVIKYQHTKNSNKKFKLKNQRQQNRRKIFLSKPGITLKETAAIMIYTKNPLARQTMPYVCNSDLMLLI